MADERVEHLLRRAGFGASADEIGAYSTMSYAAAVDRLVNYERVPDDVDTKIGQPGYVGTTSNGPFLPNTVINDARQRWLFRMLHTNRPLQEKMALFWHNYFATGYTKLTASVTPDDATRLMAGNPAIDPAGQQGQIDMLRQKSLGNMRDLLISIAQDPAMLIWLDGNTNTKRFPQENFGRELMELFSRGVGFYTETDVYAAARVFTGWNLQITRSLTPPFTASYKFIYRPENHETAEKTFSFPIYSDGSRTIPSRAASDGIQDGIDLISALAAHPETARRLVAKLYGFFVNETVSPSSSTIDQLAAVYRQSSGNIRAVVQSILLSAEFADSTSFFTRYSWPVEYVVRSLKETGWTGFSLGTTLTPLVNMGQQLFEPPDVAGWTLGQGWFSTGMMLARMNFASALSANQKFRLATAAASASAKESPQSLVSYMLTRMTPSNIDVLYSDLVTYASSGAAWTGSDVQMQTKASGLAHLILGSAEYQFL